MDLHRDDIDAGVGPASSVMDPAVMDRPGPALPAHADQRRRHVSRGRLTAGLIAWDALVPAAVLCVAALFSGLFGQEMNGGTVYADDGLALLLGVISPLALGLAGAYHQRRRRDGSRLAFGLRLLLVGVSMSWISIIVSSAAGWPIDFAQMLAFAVLAPSGWILGRWLCDRHPSSSVERVLLVGTGVVADQIEQLTTRRSQRRLVLVGRVGDQDADGDGDAGLPRLGELSDVAQLLENEGVDRVIVAFSSAPDSALVDTLRECVARGVQVDVVPRFFDLVGPAPRAHALGRLALVEVPGRGLSRSQRIVKRTSDIVGAGILLPLLSPLLALTALAILVTDGRPILFRQVREGRNGRTFQILKFRTMSVGSEPSSLVPDDEGEQNAASLIDAHKVRSQVSVTRVGRILRSTSVDELPQLWNVLKGDMSLVGPRPLAMYEAEHLDGWHVARQDLRPGLTGLWQVSGRSDIDWNERMQMDYTYVSHWSLISDVRILLRTLPAVLRKEGAL